MNMEAVSTSYVSAEARIWYLLMYCGFHNLHGFIRRSSVSVERFLLKPTNMSSAFKHFGVVARSPVSFTTPIGSLRITSSNFEHDPRTIVTPVFLFTFESWPGIASAFAQVLL
jgi:hypothetical protein